METSLNGLRFRHYYYSVRSYLLGGNPGRRDPRVLLLAVADVVAGRVRASVSMGVCPYCGRSFTSRSSVKKHLTASSCCGLQLKNDVYAVVEAYVKLRSVLRGSGATRCGSRKCRIKVYRDGRPIYFKNAAELARWIKEVGLSFLSAF